MPKTAFVLGTPFKPHPSLVTWFIVDFLLFMLLMLSCSYLPVAISTSIDPLVNLLVLSCLVIVAAFFVLWVRLYYDSMWYELHEDEMRWRRGVWFRRTGIVPYNRITNLDVVQGPVMRALSISTLSIQTAGYSGQAVPEIRIEAIEHAEELRELIRTLVRKGGSDGDGTGSGAPRAPKAPEQPVDLEILQELRKIRTLLEQER
jgi:membrane protein YdbS with pleckstrin-like domain